MVKVQSSCVHYSVLDRIVDRLWRIVLRLKKVEVEA